MSSISSPAATGAARGRRAGGFKLQCGDVWVMVAFGAVAYVLRRPDFPLAPLVLGLVLGRMFDDFLRTALIISDGSLAPLWQPPICLVLLVVLIGSFLPSTPAAHRLLVA
jgi:putative tricarboxylic transport membrane protein